MRKTAVIVAGGAGRRMGTQVPKQFLMLAGKPILVRTVELFLHFDPQLEIALVLPEAHHAYWAELAKQYIPATELGRIHTCLGGTTRTASVLAGLEQLLKQVPEQEDCLVAIHDGVRPFASQDMLREAYEVATLHQASVACVPVKASLRQSLPNGQTKAVDRSQYWQVQTPQTFRLDLILRAYQQHHDRTFTDDASLFEAAGYEVPISQGSYDNIKITTPEDLAIGEQILKRLTTNV